MSEVVRSEPKVASGTLVLGWGNPGRLDDGLGPAFAETLREARYPGVAVDVEYQLQVENAETVARHGKVVFVDADTAGPAPFSMRRLEPQTGPLTYSTHSVAPESVLALSRDLFDSEPEAWLLGIRGYDFEDFGEKLSRGAAENLAAALDFIRSAIESDSFQEVRPGSTAAAEADDSRGAS